jgi:hypothetical protein
MNSHVRFRAPWGLALMLVSVLSTLLLVGASVLCLSVLPPHQSFVRFAAGVLPLFIVLGCLPFVVRGYVLTERELVIERLGWSNRWPLASLTWVAADPDALKRSLRLCGNGGLFSFCGWFRNKKLGTYRIFGTDPKRSVVLKFGPRTIVVTPDKPAEFVAEVNRRQTQAGPPFLGPEGG